MFFSNYIKRFITVDYLASGSTTQQKLYKDIQSISLIENLADFKATVTGTFPLDISIEKSDVDLICEVHDFKLFAECLKKFINNSTNKIQPVRAGACTEDRYLCTFQTQNFFYEIFAISQPVIEQPAFVHMINEYRLLGIYGEALAKRVIELKRSGTKTEPAFAIALQIKGDPYVELYNMKFRSDSELI